MDLGAWMVIAVSLSFAAGVGLTSHVCCRLSVGKATHYAALLEIDRQRDTIDRLLARQLQRMTGDDAERFRPQPVKLLKDKPVRKPQ